MFNLKQFFMQKKNLFASAILMLCTLFVFTGCKEVMSSLDNPVSAYLKITEPAKTIAKSESFSVKDCYTTISDATPKFTTSAENIATVDANGKVKGISAGKAIITIEIPATDYYEAATGQVEVTVDALLAIDAFNLHFPSDATKTKNLFTDYHLSTKSDAAIQLAASEGSDKVFTLDPNTGDITPVHSGNGSIKISVPATASYVAEEMTVDVKVRVQDRTQLDAEVADGAEIWLDGMIDGWIDLSTTLSLADKKITLTSDKESPATIKISESIEVNSDLTLENLNIDGTGLGNSKPFIKMVTTTKKAQKKDGSASTQLLFGDIVMKNVKMSNLNYTVLSCTLGGFFNKVNIEDCIINLTGNSNMFHFGTSFAEDFTIKNSTLYSKTGHTGYLIKSDGRPGTNMGYGDDDVVGVTLDHVTMYQIAKGKQMNNSNGNMKGKKYMHQTMKDCILVYSGNHSAAVRGWMFGQNSNAPTMKYDKNTYWNDADYSATWTNSANQGYDASGTVLTTDPNFKDPANGDFTPQGADQVAKQTGDPRWFK